MNFYKPRLKLVLRLNSKIIPYKNSRLWKFNDIRGRKYLRKGYWHRQYLKLKNLKWITKRRILRSQKKWKKSNKNFKFNNAIIQRKSFLLFYGKYNFSNFKRILFLNYKKARLNKLNSFLKSFEFRISTVLFRMKLFPTIFASHFFVKTNGIFLNGNKTTNTTTLVKIGDIVSVPKKYWFFFLYIFEYKIYKRLARLISLFNRKKKMYRKFYLLSYYNKRQILTKKKTHLLENLAYKKEVKLLNVLNKNRFNNNLKKTLNVYNKKEFKYSANFKKQLSNIKYKKNTKYYINFYKKLHKSKNTKNYIKKQNSTQHVPKILKTFIDTKQQNNFFKKSFNQRYNKINKLDLNFKFNNFIYLKYQNIKFKLTKLKILKRLIKIKSKLNYFYKLIKLLKNKNLNFLWLFLFIKYKQIKYNLLNQNNLSNKILVFKNLIKTFLKTNLNLKKDNIKVYFNTVLKFYNLIWKGFEAKFNNKRNNQNYIINLIKPSLNKIIENKTVFKNIFISKQYDQMFSIFNIKKQLIFIKIFFKILITNIKILLNNNYIKFFVKTLKSDHLRINNFLLNKFRLKNDLTKKFYIIKLINNLKNENIKLNKELQLTIINNQKIFNLFKNLSKKYINNILLNNFFYKKRFFIWFKLNKNNLQNRNKQRHALNRLKRIKKKLLNKSRWRFLKKNKFERPFNEYWYIPNYIELDLKTLRGGVIKDPTYNDINYSFNLSIKNILNYYKDLGF